MKEFRGSLIFGMAALAGFFCSSDASAEVLRDISSPEELAAALERPEPDLVLRLAPGEYGALVLRDIGGAEGKPVVIRSADPADPAEFSSFVLRDTRYLVLEDLRFDYSFSAENPMNFRPFTVIGGGDLVLRGNVFDGDLATGVSAEEDGTPTGFGLSLRDVRGAVIEENEITGFLRGLTVGASSDLQIRGNDLHGLRSDGMNFAGVERVVIEENRIRDFNRAPQLRDHADMIQFWTAGTDKPSSDITIRNNVLNSGSGLFTQSIFMRNELVDGGKAGREMFYRDITIEGNVIINAHLHGISLGEVDGLKILNNSVLRNARSEGREDNPGLWTPQIRVAPTSANVAIERNVAARVAGYANQPDWIVGSNLEIQDRFPGRAGFYDQVFVAGRTGDPSDLASFAPVAGGPLDGTGIGAPRLDTNKGARTATEALRPVARILADRDFRNRFRFEAGAMGLPAGVEADQIRYDWDLGDGTKASGLAVEHEYAVTGPLEILLTATLPDGGTAQVRNKITVAGPLVLEFSSETGNFVSYAERDPVQVPNLSLGRGPAVLGQGVAPLIIPAVMITPFFQSSDFELSLRLRGVPNSRSAGELLRIHTNLHVTVTERGLLDVRFSTETAETLKIRTSMVPIFSPEWVDLTFAYSATNQRFTVIANGKVVGQGRTFGQLKPRQYWGLALGNPFGDRKSFDGELASLVLKVGQETYSGTEALQQAETPVPHRTIGGQTSRFAN